LPEFTRLGLDGTSWGTSRDHVAPRLHLCEKTRIVFEGSIDCVLTAEGRIFKLGGRLRLDFRQELRVRPPSAGTAWSVGKRSGVTRWTRSRPEVLAAAHWAAAAGSNGMTDA
jgi:hypothetical protein